MMGTYGSYSLDSIEGFQSYLNLIQQYPLLSKEQEQSLFERFQQEDDLNAARQLVLSHLRFVVKIARGYQGYGLAMSDLVQEGNVGLMKSVKRFDLSFNVRLATFAAHWIRAEILNFVQSNWRIVKIATTKSRRKLFYNLRKLKSTLTWMNKSEIADLAKTLNVKESEVKKMESTLYQNDTFFSDNLKDEENASQFAKTDYQTDETLSPEYIVEQQEFLTRCSKALHENLAQLDQRSREIIEKRWLVEEYEKLSLKQLADKYGVSGERIRQIETDTLQKLRLILTKNLN